MAVRTQEITLPLTMTYVQIADDLAARIEAGEYQAGQALPSYPEAAVLYSVGRSTIARAYGLLRDRGVAVGSPGRGVYVAEPPPSPSA